MSTTIASGVDAIGGGAAGSTTTTLPLMAKLQCLFAPPWSEVLVYLAGRLRYNPLHEVAVQEPKHAVDPFAGRSSESSRRLSRLVWRSQGVARRACEGRSREEDFRWTLNGWASRRSSPVWDERERCDDMAFYG
jgi:hypothetical protein